MNDPRARIAEELGVDLQQAEALLRTMLTATGEDLAALRAAVADADADRAVRLAHHVKGAAANLEVEDLRAAAQRLETLARQGQLDGAAAELEALERALAGLRTALSRPV